MSCFQTLVTLCSIARKKPCQSLGEKRVPGSLWSQEASEATVDSGATEDPVSQLRCCGSNTL